MNTKTTSPIDEEIENSSLRTGSQTTISELPTLSPVALTDNVIVENDTGTYKTTIADVLAGAGGGGGTSDVTKEYVDEQDALLKVIVDANADNIDLILQAELTPDADVLGTEEVLARNADGTIITINQAVLAGAGGGGTDYATKSYVDSHDGILQSRIDAISKAELKPDADVLGTEEVLARNADGTIITINQSVLAGAGGGTSDVTKEYVDEQDASIKVIVDANTDNINLILQAPLTADADILGTEEILARNADGTIITINQAVLAGAGGGTGDGTIVTLDINDYLDTTTIDCLDLDPSIVVLHLIHTGSLPTAKSSLEIAVINISFTKIERITFAPSEAIVLGSSSDANYKTQLRFFRMRLYSTTIEAGTLYRPENAPSALVVVMDTSFFMPISGTTVNVGLLEAKYSFYMERDPITNEVKELFFHDANVLFSTSKDSDIATSYFALKEHYSVCVFTDTKITNFTEHNKDLSSSDSPNPSELMAKSLLLASDGATEKLTAAYKLYNSRLFGTTSYKFGITNFFFNSDVGLSRAYLNATRLRRVVSVPYHVGGASYYFYHLWITFGLENNTLEGEISQSSDLGYANTTIKEIRLMPIQGEHGVIPVQGNVLPSFQYKPVLFMNAYYYEK